AGGSTANQIAKWNGSSWSALGSGMNSTVSALAVSGSDVYAGGDYIAKWNGSTWTDLSSGIGGAIAGTYPSVSALAVSGSEVYAGGNFATAGGSAANYIAKWNGSSWSALGSGMGGTERDVPALEAPAAKGGEVCAGGGSGRRGGAKADCRA